MIYSNSETCLSSRHRAPANPRTAEDMVLCVEQDARGSHLRWRRRDTLDQAKFRTRAVKLAAAALCLAGSILSAQAQQSYTVDLETPTIDKWIYPFAPNGGGPRVSGPTFGAVGSAGFDDRDAQAFVGFDTDTIVPAGLEPSRYQILSATFTLSLSVGDTVVYDGTYDPVNTYGTAGEPVNGDDPGRPMELFGAAFRNGFTSATIQEDTAFSTSPALSEGTRTTYPTDFVMGASINVSNRDVSNNVAEAFDPVPFAIGQVAPGDLNGDGTIMQYADVVFTLNLANPDVLRYLQLSLADGLVSFLATSLHQASFGGASVYPDYFLKENLLLGSPGRLDMQVQVVPEPSAVTLALCGFGLCVACWRGRGALRNPEECV